MINFFNRESKLRPHSAIDKQTSRNSLKLGQRERKNRKKIKKNS